MENDKNDDGRGLFLPCEGGLAMFLVYGEKTYPVGTVIVGENGNYTVYPDCDPDNPIATIPHDYEDPENNTNALDTAFNTALEYGTKFLRERGKRYDKQIAQNLNRYFTAKEIIASRKLPA
jgi:hypothetical protein